MKTYRFRWRVFTSFILFVSTIIVTLSGVALYLAPHHRVADQTSWTFLLLNEWIRVEHFEKWRESQPVDPLGDDVSVKDVGIEDVNGETGGAQERSDG
jgi:hypothetical protein